MRKAIVAVTTPIAIFIVVILALGTALSQHNNAVVYACFYGGEFTEAAPAEYKAHISRMRTSFSSLDSAVSTANANMENGSLDANRVKAFFYALCFDNARISKEAFTRCFYSEEERTVLVEVTDDNGETELVENSYSVNILRSADTAFENLSALLGREITEEDMKNANHIYSMINGDLGRGTFDGGYERRTEFSTEIDVSGFTDPASKNSHDLVEYAKQAWENGWGYVWGSYGNVMTEGTLAWKTEAYPDGVGSYEEFIRANWIGRRATDCVGLIKGYGWLDAETLQIKYGTNGMPDIGANQMRYYATEYGTIDTIPEIPGIAVWHEGHIGVYIGNGEVIEAMGTKYGVVKTKLEGRGWTHWLKIPYISYE